MTKMPVMLILRLYLFTIFLIFIPLSVTYTLSSNLLSQPAAVNRSTRSPLSNELKISLQHYPETARLVSPTDLKH